jgi:uncharacterized OB-fold protein
MPSAVDRVGPVPGVVRTATDDAQPRYKRFPGRRLPGGARTAEGPNAWEVSSPRTPLQFRSSHCRPKRGAIFHHGTILLLAREFHAVMHQHASEPPPTVCEDGTPRLQGSECPACGVIAFPGRAHCSSCLSETVPVRFERSATLEAWTTVHAGQPGFKTPYKVGFLRLHPGFIRVFSPLIEADGPAVGDRMVLTLPDDSLPVDWAFRPEATHD